MTPPIGPMDRRSFLKTVAVGAAALGTLGAEGQSRAAATAASATPSYDRRLPGGAWHYPAREELLPFGHGVASGDPLADRVILWTRVTIPDARGWDTRLVPDPQGITTVEVSWLIATDPALTDVVRSGTVASDATVDFTVKVDADGLSSATTYWYAFTALGYRSPIGRTRTAPAVGDGITELTIGHVACTSWWQDLFNGYARMGERGDIDLITHAGDHVYEVSGNHMSSRQYPDADGNPQLQPYDDIDNRSWRDVAECRRRYALYYQDENLLAAHLGAPWAIMADQHDYDDNLDDDGDIITAAQAGEVLFEWSPIRPPVPDGSGTFVASPGPDAQVPVPRGDDAFFSYRTLDFGDVAQVVLLDVRRHRDDAAAITLLGDDQWAWLQATLIAAKDRGARHNVIVSQLNLSQFVAFNPPGYDQYAEAFAEAFGQDPRVPHPIITFDWDARPDDRRVLYRWLREVDILDNIVLTGDSHGWFGSDLTEDPEPPNYTPLTGASPLQPVGVEMVGTSMGRPGAQDVIADELYWSQNGGRQNAPFDDAETYDSQHRRAALSAALAAESHGKAANKNLIYFNWKSEFGHAMVHLRTDAAIIENWVSPQRTMSSDAQLVAQHTTPLGNPHLVPVPAPTPVEGSRQDPTVAPSTDPIGSTPPATVEPPDVTSTDGIAQDTTGGDAPVVDDSPSDPEPATVEDAAPDTDDGADLAATGGGAAVIGAAALAASALARRGAHDAS